MMAMLLLIAIASSMWANCAGKPIAHWDMSTHGNEVLKSAMLQLHNNLRTQTDKTMGHLIWSKTLANRALKWADGCKFQHSNTNGYGENIAASSTTSQKEANMTEVTHQLKIHFKIYTDEGKNYTYNTNTCAKVCGHYTQLVWRKTKEVGCGIAQCPKDTAMGSGYYSFFSVCNYSPPGNVQGEKPY